MTYRVRNIAIAVGLALVAAMLTTFYVTNYKRSVQQGESQVQVYVAAKDIAAGVSGADLVKRHQLRAVQVTKRSVVAGSISDTAQVQRLVLSQPLYQGEQVTLRRFSDVKAQGILASLKGTMRAFQVPGDANQLLVGTVKTGDHVDLVANISIKIGADDGHVDRVVLRDIPVLQAPVQAGGAKVPTTDALSMIVGVSDIQVQRLFFVLKNNDWSFQLRPVVDAADSPERAENAATIIANGISDAELNRLRRGGR